MKKLPLGIGYAKAYEAMRPYLNWTLPNGKPISGAQAAKITKYFREFKRLTANPYQIFKPKTEKRLRQAQKATGQPKGFPGFKVAFVPVSGEGKAKVRLSKTGKLTVTDKNISRKVYLFEEYEREPGETLLNSDNTVSRILKDAKNTDNFVLMCGEHESKIAVKPEELQEQVENFFQTYGDAEEWFHGVIGYRFKAQSDFKAYKAAKASSKRRRKSKKT